MARTAGRIAGGVAGMAVAFLGRPFVAAVTADDVRPAVVPAADPPRVDDDVRPAAFPVPPVTIPGDAFPPAALPPVPVPPVQPPRVEAGPWRDFVATLPPVAAVAPPPDVRGPVRTAGGMPLSLDDVLESADHVCPQVDDDGRLRVQRDAARAYWAWVAAGRDVTTARNALAPARDRDGRMRDRPPTVPDPRAAFADNLRAVAHRTVLVGRAEAAFQRAQVALSLFFRDPRTGDPILAGADRLPDFPVLVEPDPDGVDAAIEAALARRPESSRVRAERTAALAGRPKLPSACLPWKRRQVAGQIRLVDLHVSALAALERKAAEGVRADVQDAFVRLERMYAVRAAAGRRVELARRAAADERRAFDRGTGDMARLLAAEGDVFDAETAETATLADYFRAVTDYRAALGVGASGHEPTQLDAPPPAGHRPPPAVDKFVPAAGLPTRAPLFPAGGLPKPPALLPLPTGVLDKFAAPEASATPPMVTLVRHPSAPLPPVAAPMNKFAR